MALPSRCPSSSRALLKVFALCRTQNVTLPPFLVPALAPSPRVTHFSSTTNRRSKIGRAPLSLPPKVTFNVIETPPKTQRRGTSRSELDRSVEIEGPLGKMKMDLPPYVSIASDAETRTHSVSILDPEDKGQKAMWGETGMPFLESTCD